MQNLIPIILIAFFVYLVFSRKGGGMGCCGGHMEPEPRRHDNVNHHSENSTQNGCEQVIDLREDEYTVVNQESKNQIKTDKKSTL